MTTFWAFDSGGGGGEWIANNIADAIEEMNRLHPNWQSAESMWNLVEVNEDANLQRFWYTDHTQTAWEAF